MRFISIFILLQNESVDVNSDADESMNESAPTSAASDIEENGVFHRNPGFLTLINSTIFDLEILCCSLLTKLCFHNFSFIEWLWIEWHRQF